MRRWFIDKYRMPPTCALFVGQTEADLHIEMYEDLCLRRDRLRQELDAPAPAHVKGSERAAALRETHEAINRINEALGDPPEEYDPVAAEWDRQLDAGGTPDFTRGHSGG